MSVRLPKFTIPLMLLGLLLSQWGLAASPKMVKVEVKQHTLTLELAETAEERALGLQNRRELCETCGMLFAFDYPTQVGFWMKDTYIPLDIAYLSPEGTVLFIGQMQPLSLKSLQSPQGTQYAWEMNQGWFAANGVKVGDKLKFLLE